MNNNTNNFEPDVIVIGGGPGGAPVAWRLASKGVKVVMLEAGGYYNPYKDYDLHSDEWHSSRFPEKKKLEYDFGNSQPLNNKYSHLKSWAKSYGNFNKTNKRRYVSYQSVAGLGGSALHFQGEAHRLNPAAFNMKTSFGVASDWPVSYESLEPYYTAVEKIVGVAGPDKLPGRFRSEPYPMPAHEISYSSKVIKESCDKLGYKLLPNPVAILSRPYRNNAPCNYCCGCSWGCPRKDKGSPDVTFIPLATKTGNCRIIVNAFVSRIEVKKENGVKASNGVHYFDDTGKEYFIKAKYIVIAGGAVQTPRLLINSELNKNGLVGKNFMETTFFELMALHPKRLDSYRGIPIDSVIWDWNDPSKNKDLSAGYRIYPTAGNALSPVHYANYFFQSSGKKLIEDMGKWFGHAIGIAGIGEFQPNKDTFVTVSDKKDRFGLPIAKIQSFNSETELKILDSMYNKAKQILEASGAKEFVEQYSTYDLFSASHVFGTCKMGKNPEDSVVNQNLESHEVKNMYVTDASVFPSSGGGEAPSLTIQALSLRAADAMLKKTV
ncbi:MAG: GMC family oxidoreductase [Thermodesulfobacteriota bacterium]